MSAPISRNSPSPGSLSEDIAGIDGAEALLRAWPIFEAFQLTYVSKGLLLEQEKNVSALSPTGPSRGRAILRRLPNGVRRLPGAAEPATDP